MKLAVQDNELSCYWDFRQDQNYQKIDQDQLKMLLLSSVGILVLLPGFLSFIWGIIPLMQIYWRQPFVLTDNSYLATFDYVSCLYPDGIWDMVRVS